MSEKGDESINDISEKIIQECTSVSQIFFNITNYLKEFQQLKEEYIKEIYGKISLSQNSNSSEYKNMGIRTEDFDNDKFYNCKKNKKIEKRNDTNEDNKIEQIQTNQHKVKSIFEDDINIENINNNNKNINNINNKCSTLFKIFNEIREDILNKPESQITNDKKKGKKAKKKSNKNNYTEKENSNKKEEDINITIENKEESNNNNNKIESEKNNNDNKEKTNTSNNEKNNSSFLSSSSISNSESFQFSDIQTVNIPLDDDKISSSSSNYLDTFSQNISSDSNDKQILNQKTRRKSKIKKYIKKTRNKNNLGY